MREIHESDTVEILAEAPRGLSALTAAAPEPPLVYGLSLRIDRYVGPEADHD